ncbi:hypothetical protein D9M68_551090 [compost metagenome]
MIYLKISKELRAKLDAEPNGRVAKKKSAIAKNKKASKTVKTVEKECDAKLIIDTLLEEEA